MMQPLISDAAGATPSLLQLQEYLENIGAGFRLEGVELEEVSNLPSEEAEVSEQPLEGVSGEVLGWKESHSSVGDCWKGLRIGSTPKCLWNWCLRSELVLNHC